MVTNKENLFLLGKKITDRIPYKLGLKKVDETCPEYTGFVNVLNDEMVEIALKMKVRTPYTLKDMVALTGKEEEHLYEMLQEMSTIGLLEYHYGEKYDRKKVDEKDKFQLFRSSVKTISKTHHISDKAENKSGFSLAFTSSLS